MTSDLILGSREPLVIGTVIVDAWWASHKDGRRPRTHFFIKREATFQEWKTFVIEQDGEEEFQRAIREWGEPGPFFYQVSSD